MRQLLGWFLAPLLGGLCCVMLSGIAVEFLLGMVWFGCAGGWVCARLDSGYRVGVSGQAEAYAKETGE